MVFVNKDLDFVYVVPMKENTGDEIRYALLKFIEDVGIPEVLKSDRAASIMNTHVPFNRLCTNLGIKRRFFESHRHEGNCAESAIRDLKRRWKFDMSRRTVPNRFWDFGLIYHAEIITRICRRRDGKTSIEHVTGETPDISNWLDFTFYEPCWYMHYHGNVMDKSKASIGRWLGVSHNVSYQLCYYVLTDKGRVIARHSVQHITEDELKRNDINRKMVAFDNAIKIRKDQVILDTTQWHDLYVLDLEAHADDSSPDTDFTPSDDNDVAYEEEDLHKDVVFEPLDNLIGAEALLPCGGENAEAVVVKRVKGLDGKPIGTYNANPLLDTRKYLVRFKSGEEDEFKANMVAENMTLKVGNFR